MSDRHLLHEFLSGKDVGIEPMAASAIGRWFKSKRRCALSAGAYRPMGGRQTGGPAYPFGPCVVRERRRAEKVRPQFLSLRHLFCLIHCLC
jgi:hypothetical protein